MHPSTPACLAGAGCKTHLKSRSDNNTTPVLIILIGVHRFSAWHKVLHVLSLVAVLLIAAAFTYTTFTEADSAVLSNHTDAMAPTSVQ